MTPPPPPPFPHPRVFDMLQYLKKNYIQRKPFDPSQQGEVYFMSGGAAGGL